MESLSRLCSIVRGFSTSIFESEDLENFVIERRASARSKFIVSMKPAIDIDSETLSRPR